ncbi:MAG: hypothetical protein ACYST5_11545 [Planctomycetota bacterium]|jgi:hypothetical protein
MSVNSILTKDYERNDIFAVPENKDNSNPNKPNFKGKKVFSAAEIIRSAGSAFGFGSRRCLVAALF